MRKCNSVDNFAGTLPCGTPKDAGLTLLALNRRNILKFNKLVSVHHKVALQILCFTDIALMALDLETHLPATIFIIHCLPYSIHEVDLFARLIFVYAVHSTLGWSLCHCV